MSRRIFTIANLDALDESSNRKKIKRNVTKTKQVPKISIATKMGLPCDLYDHDEVPTTDKNFLSQNRGRFVRWSKIREISKEKEFTYLTSDDTKEEFVRKHKMNLFDHPHGKYFLYSDFFPGTRQVNNRNYIMLYDYLIKYYTTNEKTSIKCMMKTPKIRRNICVLTPCDDTWVYIDHGLHFENVNIISFRNVFETELGRFYLNEFPSFLEFASESVRKTLEDAMFQQKKEILKIIF